MILKTKNLNEISKVGEKRVDGKERGRSSGDQVFGHYNMKTFGSIGRVNK